MLTRLLTTILLALSIGMVPAFSAKSGDVSVRGYTRKDGTYVSPHMRSAPDKIFDNNWSTRGNVNPYTGAVGTRDYPNDYYCSPYPNYEGPRIYDSQPEATCMCVACVRQRAALRSQRPIAPAQPAVQGATVVYQNTGQVRLGSVTLGYHEDRYIPDYIHVEVEGEIFNTGATPLREVRLALELSADGKVFLRRVISHRMWSGLQPRSSDYVRFRELLPAGVIARLRQGGGEWKLTVEGTEPWPW